MTALSSRGVVPGWNQQKIELGGCGLDASGRANDRIKNAADFWKVIGNEIWGDCMWVAGAWQSQ